MCVVQNTKRMSAQAKSCDPGMRLEIPNPVRLSLQNTALVWFTGRRAVIIYQTVVEYLNPFFWLVACPCLRR